jgi:hypothetical protein
VTNLESGTNQLYDLRQEHGLLDQQETVYCLFSNASLPAVPPPGALARYSQPAFLATRMASARLRAPSLRMTVDT